MNQGKNGKKRQTEQHEPLGGRVAEEAAHGADESDANQEHREKSEPVADGHEIIGPWGAIADAGRAAEEPVAPESGIETVRKAVHAAEPGLGKNLAEAKD